MLIHIYVIYAKTSTHTFQKQAQVILYFRDVICREPGKMIMLGRRNETQHIGKL